MSYDHPRRHGICYSDSFETTAIKLSGLDLKLAIVAFFFSPTDGARAPYNKAYLQAFHFFFASNPDCITQIVCLLCTVYRLLETLFAVMKNCGKFIGPLALITDPGRKRTLNRTRKLGCWANKGRKNHHRGKSSSSSESFARKQKVA